MSKKLAKAKVDEGKAIPEKQKIRSERAESWERKDYGMHSGKSANPAVSKFLHQAKLSQIKETPKPNFPKEPVEKTIEAEAFYDEHKKKIHAEGKARRAKIEQRKANPTLVDKIKKWASSKVSPAIPKPVDIPKDNPPNKLAAAEKTPVVMSAKQAVDEHKNLVNVLRSPSHKDDLKEAKEQESELKEYKEKLDKAIIPVKSGVSPNQIKQQNEQLPPVKPYTPPPATPSTHVSGVKIPHELHSFMQSGEVVPYDHPHREKAAAFVTDVWRRNKPEGQRMSEKLLGVSENGKKNVNAKPAYGTMKAEKKEFAAPIPADVSAPAIINARRTNTGRHYISGPDKVSAYPSTVQESGTPKKEEKKSMKKSELAKALKTVVDSKLEKANRFETAAGMGTKEANKNPAIAAVKQNIRANTNEGNKGVHIPVAIGRDVSGGEMVGHLKNPSLAGAKVRRGDIGGAKTAHEDVLSQLKAMPKPNLPKSEPVNKIDPVSHLPGTMLDKADEVLAKRKALHARLSKCLKMKMDQPVTKSEQDSLKKNFKNQGLSAKEIVLAAKARAEKKAAANQAQMAESAARQKMQESALLPENIKLDRPKYLTIDQHVDSTIMGKPHPLQERGQKSLQHINDAKELNQYYGKNVISGIHDQPVKMFGKSTYLLHPDGKMEYQHSDFDTSDSRNK